jgi:hypothetical protein
MDLIMNQMQEQNDNIEILYSKNHEVENEISLMKQTIKKLEYQLDSNQMVQIFESKII